MAIIGGAGQTIGGTFTGPSEALEIIGDHAYAYSGSISIPQAETTMLEFTTGNHYVVGAFQFQLLQDSANDIFNKVYLNNSLVTGYLKLGAQQSTDANNLLQFVIPPYSEVKITCENLEGTANGCVTYVGDVYRRTRD